MPGSAQLSARVAWLLAAVLCLSPWSMAQAQATGACALDPGPTRTVARVIDAETLALDDGREVRLIGALAPRARDVGAVEGTWPHETQARETLASLVLGKTVELRQRGRLTDRYGRLLAQAFVEIDGRAAWVQAELVVRGLARAYGLLETESCAPELIAVERHARTLRLGLWAAPAYRIRRTGPHFDLARDAGAFHLVEGTIRRAIEGREGVTLYLGPRSGGELVISVPRERKGLILEGKQRASGQRGRLVRARGWIEAHPGPAIEIVHAGQLEPIERFTPGQGRLRVPARPRNETR